MCAPRVDSLYGAFARRGRAGPENPKEQGIMTSSEKKPNVDDRKSGVADRMSQSGDGNLLRSPRSGPRCPFVRFASWIASWSHSSSREDAAGGC